MKNYFTFLFILFFCNCFSQLNDLSNDSINNVFYRALLWDGLPYYYKNQDLLKFCKENVKSSEKLELKFSFGHRVCFYKVSIKYLQLDNGENYKILHIEAKERLDVYIRLYGFQENDFIHLYERILKQYLPKRKIIEHVEKWQELDSVFKSVNFKELVYSIKNMNNQVPAMISHTLKSHTSTVPTILSQNAQFYYKEFYLTNKVYAYFSNRPLDGSLTYNIPYSKRKIIFRKNKECDCF
jgi:hypothetical protein